jgi:hypothetical protein
MTEDPVAPDRFRTCGSCRRHWPTAAAFLDDAAVTVVGLQVAQHLPEANLIVFEHSCGSSVAACGGCASPPDSTREVADVRQHMSDVRRNGPATLCLTDAAAQPAADQAATHD